MTLQEETMKRSNLQSGHRSKPSGAPAALLALLVSLPAAAIHAQTSAATPAPKQATAPSQAGPSGALKAGGIGAQNLIDRPYSSMWPKPSFPTGDRQQKQFTVEYVYRYLQDDYKPAVTLTHVPRSAAEQDTPEHTLAALITAIQTLDYDWWVSLWDTRSREIFEQQAKEKKFDAAWWKARWQRSFQGKTVVLVTRLETVSDIILEIRVGPQTPGQPSPLNPFTFRLEQGKWYATQELGDSGFLPFFGQDTMTQNLDFTPDPHYSQRDEPPVVGKSQRLFFRNQTRGESSATDFVW
jgi:hypothetical protein